ncbi:MAG: hypothetical protein IGS39_21975 [Calothrix sp. C42_A2020_038]|nr:hypothetical protein [Calothrix sp. C42_A2020_038]
MHNLYFTLNHYRSRKYTASRLLIAITSLVLLATNYGCTQKTQNEVSLEIKNIQSSSSSGVYKVVGTTNLPESSQIAITAVRYLRNDSQTVDADLEANRSILDRKIVEVKQGQWQADLNLWQVSPDGSYKEIWQQQSNSQQTPENDVIFTATFDPQGQIQKLENQNTVQSQTQTQSLEGKSLRFTNQGEKYVQASQSLSIPLPTGKTVPPQRLAEDINDGWGNRYTIQPETVASVFTPPEVSKSRQTTARLSKSEFLR